MKNLLISRVGQMKKKKSSRKKQADFCNDMDFNLKQCETFCKVVELKSFSKAAADFHITQASASERVANLEKIVGIKLLDRLGRQIVPSSAGKMLYKKAKELLAYKEQACWELNEFLGVQRGDISVGGSTIPGEFILPMHLGEFRQLHPDIQIKLEIGDTRKIVNKILDGCLEIAVVGSKESNQLIVSERLWDDELVLAVNSEHRWASKRRVTIKELQDEPFIIRELGSATRYIVEKHLMDSQNLSFNDFNIVAVLGSSTAVKEGVKNNLGVSILSKWSIVSELECGKIKAVQIQNLKILRNFFLIHDKRRAQSPLCSVFRQFLLDKTYEK